MKKDEENLRYIFFLFTSPREANNDIWYVINISREKLRNMSSHSVVACFFSSSKKNSEYTY